MRQCSKDKIGAALKASPEGSLVQLRADSRSLRVSAFVVAKTSSAGKTLVAQTTQVSALAAAGVADQSLQDGLAFQKPSRLASDQGQPGSAFTISVRV